MKKLTSLLLLSLLILSCANEQKKRLIKLPGDNPFNVGLNEPIDYAKVNGAHIEQYINVTMENTAIILEDLKEGQIEAPKKVLLKFDAMFDRAPIDTAEPIAAPAKGLGHNGKSSSPKATIPEKVDISHMNLKQILAGMPKVFNPDEAGDLAADIQFHVTGMSRATTTSASPMASADLMKAYRRTRP